MNTSSTILFLLLQRAVGKNASLPQKIDAETWQQVYALAKQQALLGIVFLAIDSLTEEQRPPKALIMQWWGMTERIKQQSKRLNEVAEKVEQQFAADGLRGVVLKGVGMAALYPHPLNRTPGDVDLWLEGERKEIVAYVKRFKENPFVIYHHVDFVDVDGVSIELHFTPSYFSDLFTNYKFQKWVRKERGAQMEHFTTLEGGLRVHTPTAAFNRVYILSHIYRHMFDEGVGLRQLMDYYYVLRQGFTEAERQETITILKQFKMVRFAEAVMWVLQEVFGLEAKYMLTTPNEREGKFLLDEIMMAGNFGHYDSRIIRSQDERLFIRFVRRTVRNLRFLRSYPSEVIWSPIFKIIQRIWMLKWN